MKRDELIKLFEFFLSQPPCRGGVRLRSEPELACILLENRQKIRRALDDLAERGYISRLRGSGTFVRKVFPAREAPPREFVAERTRVLPDQIFQPLNETQFRGAFRPEGQSLRIGLPAEIRLLTRTNCNFYDGVVRHLTEAGHIAEPYREYQQGLEVFKTAEELAEELRRAPCDGYIVENAWAENFNAAARLAFDGNPPPMVYYWTGSVPISGEPLIQFDTNEALHRGLLKLVEAGYRRIALVTMEDIVHGSQPERRYYAQTIQKAGLDYEEIITLPGPLGAGLASSLNALFERNPPDALYIADDHFLPGCADFFRGNRLVPGRDIGVITLSNRGGELSDQEDWSRLEFDPARFGAFTVEILLQCIRTPDAPFGGFSCQATWKPGKTIKQKE